MAALHTLQRRVKREGGSLRNHLLSIVQDTDVVHAIHDIFSHNQYPLYGNRRNGCWYTTALSELSCYFKSMDGHHGNWAFSCSRINLEFAGRAASKGGVIVVDSTARGKRFPDSFSATIPIWCAVVNTIVFQRSFSFCAPPWVQASATAQINSLLQSFVDSVDSVTQDMIRQLLLPLLKVPFQPVWVCPSEDGALEWFGDGAESLLEDDANLPFTPLIMLSCSAVTNEAVHSQHHSWKYVQGAGDDEESWALGLTPSVFVANQEAILASDDHVEVEAVVRRIVSEGKAAPARSAPDDDDEHVPSSSSAAATQSLLPVGKSGLWVGWSEPSSSFLLAGLQATSDSSLMGGRFSGVIQFVAPDHTVDVVSVDTLLGYDGIPVLRIHAAADKQQASNQPRTLWSRQLVPAVIQFYQQLQALQPDACSQHPTAQVAVMDRDGGTLACTAVLAILLSCFDTSLDFADYRTGPLTSLTSLPRLTKSHIRGTLAALHMHVPASRDIPRRLMIELNNVFVGGDRSVAPLPSRTRGAVTARCQGTEGCGEEEEESESGKV